MKNKKTIYLDNAATTKIDGRVLAEMMPCLKENYGNPSSLHQLGVEAKQAIENARERIAKILNCSPDEIIFTSGGTESDYLAVIGTMSTNSERNELIVSQIEHPAVLKPAEALFASGTSVKYLPVNSDGYVTEQILSNAINKNTKLVSIMHANNEIGTVQPIKNLAKIAHKSGAIFHTDACQTAGFENLDVQKLGVDLLSLNGSKIYGPKGVGLLFVKNGVQFNSPMSGGGQENQRRGGTENVAGIVGLAKALEIAQDGLKTEAIKVKYLRDRLANMLQKIPGTKIIGGMENRLPNNLNMKFNIDASNFIQSLDDRGICASAGSACSASSTEPSHVLLAIGLDYVDTFKCVRFSLGRFNTAGEIDFVVKTIYDILNYDGKY